LKKIKTLRKKSQESKKKLAKVTSSIRKDQTTVTESSQEQKVYTQKLLRTQCAKMVTTGTLTSTSSSFSTVGGVTTSSSTSSSRNFAVFDKTGGAMCPCGGGPTGVSQVSFTVYNQDLARELLSNLYGSGLVSSDGQLVPVTRVQPSSATGVSAASTGFRLFLTTGDGKLPQLLTLIRNWSVSNNKSNLDVMVTPLTDGFKEFLSSVTSGSTSNIDLAEE
jgi:hypothetical protein